MANQCNFVKADDLDPFDTQLLSARSREYAGVDSLPPPQIFKKKTPQKTQPNMKTVSMIDSAASKPSFDQPCQTADNNCLGNDQNKIESHYPATNFDFYRDSNEEDALLEAILGLNE